VEFLRRDPERDIWRAVTLTREPIEESASRNELVSAGDAWCHESID
jgi:hypothetical protein